MSRRIFAILVLTLAVLVPVLVWAQSVTWNAAFEAQPDATKPVSEGDDRIRELKTADRERGDVEARWDSVNQNIQTNDNSSGRHRPGTARTFLQDGAPSDLLSQDALGSSALDGGRLWVETDPGTTRSVATGNLRMYVRDETNVSGLGIGWHSVIGVPKFGIILWDQTAGDVDCDGNPTSGECPCGFVEATEFRGIFARGADVAASSADIPDGPGIQCTGPVPGVGCGAAGGADNYDDTLTADEIPAHTHSVTLPRGDNDHGNPALNTDPFDAVQDAPADVDTVITSGSTGGGEAQYHPFRSVLFCRAR